MLRGWQGTQGKGKGGGGGDGGGGGGGGGGESGGKRQKGERVGIKVKKNRKTMIIKEKNIISEN